MKQFIVDNPEVSSALIAAVVALIVATVSGIYTLAHTRRKLDDLRGELVAQTFTGHAAKRFLEAHDGYLRAYKKYENRIREMAKDLDGRDRIQLIIDFYAEQSRPMLEQYPDFLGPEIVRAGGEMQKSIDNLAEHFAPNDPSKLHYAAAVQTDGFALNKLISEVRPR